MSMKDATHDSASFRRVDWPFRQELLQRTIIPHDHVGRTAWPAASPNRLTTTYARFFESSVKQFSSI